jgi:hypothetical protein
LKKNKKKKKNLGDLVKNIKIHSINKSNEKAAKSQDSAVFAIVCKHESIDIVKEELMKKQKE